LADPLTPIIKLSKALYICYFGVNEPLVQTQVIPYLRELVKGGHELSLLTFEPGEVDEASVRGSLAEDGIDWYWLRYHKRPSVPATLFDIANGARFIAKLAKKQHFDILHARAHIPMIMAHLVRKWSISNARLLFDIRGFVPEEYADAGVWKDGGTIYQTFKRVERRLMAEADGFIVLTEAARDVLFAESRETGIDRHGRPVAVIPCCVDFERRFSMNRAAGRMRIRSELGIENRFVFAHVGALGGLYLSDEIADLLTAAKRENEETFGLFLTQSDPNLIVPRLKDRGFVEGDFFVGRVPADRVGDYLYASDVGLSFVKATFATKSRSPTKIPEYLAAGLPVLANEGVGDVNALLEKHRAGILIDELSEHGYKKALRSIFAFDTDRDSLIKLAHESFDLETVGGQRYGKMYSSLVPLARGPR
jgi:glycosyltransferase involved in cell wall biosynthesis